MAGDGSMIIDRELDQKGTDENIGTSRVNLTQRYVESVKYNGLGDFTEELREEADYRKRIEKIFSEIHMVRIWSNRNIRRLV